MHPCVKTWRIPRNLRREVPSFDPCMFFAFQKSGSAVGVITTDISDILGRGKPDVLPRVRRFSEKRYGELEVQEGSFVNVAMELANEEDFFVKSSHGSVVSPMGGVPIERVVGASN